VRRIDALVRFRACRDMQHGARAWYPAPDTRSMRDEWVHVGRLWTNGEPFLAVDAALRGAWQGHSNDDFDQLSELGWQDTSVPVGTGRAVIVGADGVVRDDSWMEVFETGAGVVAIVQASGPDYPEVLARALRYPAEEDEDGDALAVGSGEIAIFSSALDGKGPHSDPFASARPGQVPPVYRACFYGEPPPSGLLLPAPHVAYKLKVRWYTILDEDNCFARWLLVPRTPTTDQADAYGERSKWTDERR
jgi:hypothetical protein